VVLDAAHSRPIPIFDAAEWRCSTVHLSAPGVMGWFAEHADLVIVLFDPNKFPALTYADIGTVHGRSFPKPRSA